MQFLLQPHIWADIVTAVSGRDNPTICYKPYFLVIVGYHSLHNFEAFAKALIVHYLSLSKEAKGSQQRGVICHAHDMLVCRPCLLLCRQILNKIGDGVARCLNVCSCERYTVRIGREHRMIM